MHVPRPYAHFTPDADEQEVLQIMPPGAWCWLTYWQSDGEEHDERAPLVGWAVVRRWYPRSEQYATFVKPLVWDDQGVWTVDDWAAACAMDDEVGCVVPEAEADDPDWRLRLRGMLNEKRARTRQRKEGAHAN